MTKEFETKIQEIIDEACDKYKYSTDGGESLFLENQVKDIVKKAIEGIWHKASNALPINEKECLVEYSNWSSNSWYDVGYYDEDSSSFQIDIDNYIKMNNVTRWAYLEDIVDL